MSGGWPSNIDPVQLAEQGARLEGTLPLSSMRRLTEACADGQGSIVFDLHFERNLTSNLRSMHGVVTASVVTTCQRCLGPMQLTLRATPRFILLRPGERDELADSDDALVVRRPLALGTLIEDELLLNLPMNPMHDVGRCPATPRARPTTDANRKPHSFAALSRLRKNTDDS